MFFPSFSYNFIEKYKLFDFSSLKFNLLLNFVVPHQTSKIAHRNCHKYATIHAHVSNVRLRLSLLRFDQKKLNLFLEFVVAF